jgi:hypothetical protein
MKGKTVLIIGKVSHDICMLVSKATIDESIAIAEVAIRETGESIKKQQTTLEDLKESIAIVNRRIEDVEVKIDPRRSYHPFEKFIQKRTGKRKW